MAWEGICNVFPAAIAFHSPEQRATHSETRRWSRADRAIPRPFLGYAGRSSRSAPTTFCSPASRSGGLSARNQIAGVVERIIPHGPDAEAVVRTGRLSWIVSVVTPAVDQLALAPGTSIHMIIKARSCHILHEESDDPNSTAIPSSPNR